MDFTEISTLLETHLKDENDLQFVDRILHGPNPPRKLEIHNGNLDIEVKGYSFHKGEGPGQCQRQVRVGIFQNSIVKKTSEPIREQKEAILQLGKNAVILAAQNNVQIFCFQECWNMPIFFCTQKKLPWTEFAEDAYEGPTTKMLCELAKAHNMVIISPVLEREKGTDLLWNSAVIISNYGNVLGVSRKNHIPISGKFGETYYYNSSKIGHPVFETDFGRIAVAICYDRHFPSCFLSYAINKAEIVFNPSATVKSFSESFWLVEARDAARQNGLYVAAINRVGLEEFEGEQAHPFYGSSYIVGPDGSKTPGLSLTKNALLIADLDLNKCSLNTPKERMEKLQHFPE